MAEFRGQVQLILGPMFSGKSSELMRRIRRFAIAQNKCMVVKYSNDKRYSVERLATHDQQTMEAHACERLDEVREEAEAYDCVGIDEGQFFPEIAPFCEELANAGKTVIVAALDGTFQRKPFGSILDLIPMAEQVTKLSAVCHVCFRDASFSKRLGSETAVEVIGGVDKYLAVCRTCYFADQAPKVHADAVAATAAATSSSLGAAETANTVATELNREDSFDEASATGDEGSAAALAAKTEKQPFEGLASGRGL